MSANSNNHKFEIGKTLDLGKLVEDLVKNEVQTELEDVLDQLADLRAAVMGKIPAKDLSDGSDADA